MRNLRNFLGALALTGIVLAGCETDYSKLHKNMGVREEQIVRGNTYWDFAVKLKKEYPEKLGEIDTKNLYMYLEEINGNRGLIAGEKVKLPVY